MNERQYSLGLGRMRQSKLLQFVAKWFTMQEQKIYKSLLRTIVFINEQSDITLLIQLTNQMSLPAKGKFSTFHFNKSVKMGAQTKNQDRIDVSRASISVINHYEDYRKNTGIKLGEQRYDQIKQSLQTEDLAKKNYEKRMKNHQYYVGYKKNPFLTKDTSFQSQLVNEASLLNRENLPLSGENTPKAKKRQVTIIEGLSNLKSKLEKSKIKATLKLTERKLQEIDITTFNNRQKIVNFEQISASKKTARKGETPNIEPSELPSLKKASNKEDPFQDLEYILKINEANYYQQRNGKSEINLFSVLFTKQGERILERGPRLLEKYKFCQDSLVKQKETNFHVFSGDHISTRQRQQALNKQKYKAQNKDELQDELDINLEKVKFQDLINVAGAKIDSQKVRTHLNGLKQINQVKREDFEVVYLQNQKHELSNKDSLMEENTYLKGLHHNKTQIKQLQLSEYYRKKLEKLLTKERTTIDSNIKDVRVLAAFNKQKSQIISQQMEALVNKPFVENDTQRLIRINKIRKDRCVSIKNSVVLSTLISKKVYQNASKSRSHSKSKMMNWR